MGGHEEGIEPPGDSRGRAASPADLLGAHIRVVARRGYVLEGTCLDVWRLRHGGLAVTIKPDDGSAPRELTTLVPPVILGQPGGRRR